MKRCENCNKAQKKLNACPVHTMWLCDKCYSHTLNPYTHEREQMTPEQFETWLWSVEVAALNKNIKGGNQ